jgi:hypothetical protein
MYLYLIIKISSKMNKYALLPLLFTLFFLKSNAQCTNPFYQFKEGTIMEIEHYDANGKPQSKNETRVISWSTTSSGYEATLGYKLFDKKGKQYAEGEYKMECIDGIIRIEMSAFVPDESMQAFQDMEMEMKMDNLEFPPDLTEGQTLKDASFEMIAKNSPIPMNLNFTITDRKVEGRESVTTPAGTFNCFKISEITHTKMMISNNEFKTVQYLAEKYGSVKTETYRSNGKLMGYSLLTRFEE